MESCRRTVLAAAWTRKRAPTSRAEATGQAAETFVLRRIGGSWRVRHIHFSGKRLDASSKLRRAKAAQ